MDVRTLVALVRDSYVKAFERAIRDYRTNRSKHYLLEYSLGQPEPQEGRFSLPVRHDLLPLIDGKPGSIVIFREQKPAMVVETMAEVNSIPVKIRQFTWDQFELRLNGVRPTADLMSILHWYDRWFDRLGRRPEIGAVRGVIHSMDGPFWDMNGLTIEVDLGTATADALLDLLHAASHLKPSSMEVRTPSQQAGPAGWHVTAPEGWELAEQVPGQPYTYMKDGSLFRIAIEEDGAKGLDVNEAELSDSVRKMAYGGGARKAVHIVTGRCPLGIYAYTEWRHRDHGTIRLWMLTNYKDMVTVSLIGDTLSQRDFRLITDCVRAIVPRDPNAPAPGPATIPSQRK